MCGAGCSPLFGGATQYGANGSAYPGEFNFWRDVRGPPEAPLALVCSALGMPVLCVGGYQCITFGVLCLCCTVPAQGPKERHPLATH